MPSDSIRQSTAALSPTGEAMLNAQKTEATHDDDAQLPYTLPDPVERMKPETLLKQLDVEIDDARRKLQALTEARMALAAIYEAAPPLPAVDVPSVYRAPNEASDPRHAAPPPLKRPVSPAHASQVKRQCVCSSIIQGPSFFRHVKECRPYKLASKAAKARASEPLKGEK